MFSMLLIICVGAMPVARPPRQCGRRARACPWGRSRRSVRRYCVRNEQRVVAADGCDDCFDGRQRRGVHGV